MKAERDVVYAYCRCGRRFRADECVGGRVPAHIAERSPFDVPGYVPRQCLDSNTVPVHVGAIV